MKRKELTAIYAEIEQTSVLLVCSKIFQRFNPLTAKLFD